MPISPADVVAVDHVKPLDNIPMPDANPEPSLNSPLREAPESGVGPMVAFPARDPGRPPNNLPSELSSFVGGEKELAEVRRMLGNKRLLTLSGPGGCGKTRWALAAQLAGRFEDGVWLVELA